MAYQDALNARSLRFRVLVLDLDDRTLITLERVMEEAGFDTATTWSSREAFSWLEKQRFELMIVGDHPPEIDAYAMLHRLRTIHRHVPSIVMRAARPLPDDPNLNEFVVTLPGCAAAEILAQAHRILSRSVLQTTRPSVHWANASRQ